MTPKQAWRGFSGGVDSFCVLADHFYDPAPGSARLTHLLFNNVGSHGAGGDVLFRRRYHRLRPLAHRTGLPFVVVNSNLDAFYSPRLGFLQTHTLRNASVALLLQGGMRSWLYASNGHLASQARTSDSTGDILGDADVLTLPLLSTETITLSSSGAESSRVEKTLRIARVPDSYDSLDVCVSPWHTGPPINCSACSKCLRTLATLEMAGLLDRYARVFRLDRYQRLREGYLATLPTSTERYARALFRFAKERHFPLPSRTIDRAIRYEGLRRWHAWRDHLWALTTP